MKKQSEIGFLLVSAPVDRELHSKPFKLSNNPIIQLEGYAFHKISLRLDSDRLAKLNKLLQKMQIEPLKDSDNTSEKLRLFIDNLYLHFFSVTSDVTTVSEFTKVSEPENNQCLHRVGDNRCSRFFLKKGKIIEVDSDFCSHCWALQQNLALQTKVNSTPASPAINFYKKPEKVYCINDTLYVDPAKNQAKCYICKRDRFRMWAECQQKQQYAKEVFNK